MGKPVIKGAKKLKRLLHGRHAKDVVQDAVPLSKDASRGILKALRQLDAGEGRSLAEVVSEIRGGASRA